jgi:hypothetical protein
MPTAAERRPTHEEGADARAGALWMPNHKCLGQERLGLPRRAARQEVALPA